MVKKRKRLAKKTKKQGGTFARAASRSSGRLERDRGNPSSPRGARFKSSSDKVLRSRPDRSSKSDEQVLEVLKTIGEPVGVSVIADHLQLSGSAVKDLSRQLHRLRAEGHVFEPRPGRYVVNGKDGEFIGRVVRDNNEPGFLLVELAQERRLPVHPGHGLGAQVGDEVQCMLNRQGQAMIVRVVKRVGREMPGSINYMAGQVNFIPDNRREGSLPIVGNLRQLRQHYQAGERVVGSLIEDGQRLAIEILRPLDASSPEQADFEQVVLAHDLPGPFPPAVEAAAKKWDQHFTVAGREDLRQSFIFTIDPETAKDFDDAISLERLGSGWRIGVHIADVSHFVEQGGIIDQEATKRGTSCYLINRVIPMLPEYLSNGLCSLVPHQDRYALSVFIDLDQGMRIVSVRPTESIICSRHRLTYEQALAVLQRQAEPDQWPQQLIDQLFLCHRVAQGLRSNREKAGALNLYSEESAFSLDVEGNPIEVTQESGDIAHQLIEEFMLLANRAIAQWLGERQSACVYRVHGEPDEKKVEFLHRVLDAYGLQDYNATDRFQLQRLLMRLIKEAPAPRLVMNFMVLRSFQKAIYAVDNIGHFALAFHDYLHFTSPIRRYPDLIVHRLVKRELGLEAYAQAINEREHLDALARQCSYLEQRAELAEREIRAIKAARYLDRRVGDTFAGVVTNVARHGMYVRLLEVGFDGLVPMADLGDDFFTYDAERMALIGERNGLVFGIGSECEVVVSRVDIPRGEVNLAVV